jgi:hypothetical protein
MKQTLDNTSLENAFSKLEKNQFEIRNAQSEIRQPVHVVYGGADRFRADTPQKLGKIALKSLHDYAPEAASLNEIFFISRKKAAQIYKQIEQKLETEPVEDFRIDFEDGYGFRSGEEEDEHAISASDELARSFHENTISPFSGFRVKSFQPETAKRAVRTLDLFLTNFLDKTAGRLPENFVVTLPKVETETQVTILSELLAEFEAKNGLPENALKLEILIETPQAIVNERGEVNLRKLIEAANERCVAAHFGAYDFTSAFGIVAEFQHLNHPLCHFARQWMQVVLSPLNIRLSDSVTTKMPIPPHKGENLTENQIKKNVKVVHQAWLEHYLNVEGSLESGFYQSWDLHPAQLPARYAAVYSFFSNSLDSSAERLRAFLDKATKASLTGNQFDDAASANGLLNFFTRARSCGAIDEKEILEKTGLTAEELRLGSFAKIMENKR